MLVNKDLIKNKIQGLNVIQRGELMWDIKKEFYDEKPVSIERFYKDKHFLGNSFVSQQNGIIIYPFWRDILDNIYPHSMITTKDEVIVEAPIGSGKSYASVLSILYELYRVNCLTNPTDYFGLGGGTMIIFLFFSLDLSTANINWQYAKDWLSSSPYFTEFWQPSKAKQLPDGTTPINKDKQLFINIGSQMQHGISRAIHSFCLDESNFYKIKGQDKENYENLSARVLSRFPNKDGIQWIVSSASSDGCFMDQVKDGSQNIKRSWIIPCPPQWIIKGRDNFSSDTFQVFAGDVIRDAFIINDDTKHQITDDMSLIDVPINFFDLFQKKLIKSLRDLANHRTSNTSKFFKSKVKLQLMMSIPNRVVDPVSNKALEVIFLDEKDERDTLIQYFEKHIEYFKNPMNPQCLRFVHMDIGRTKDKFTLACSYATYTDEEFYRTPTEISKNSERFYYTDFFVAIKAKQGQQIPYYKIHNLFLWLRDVCGYDIELITTDQREGGAKLRQDLNISGFNVDYLSVDRTKDAYDITFEIVQEEKCITPKNELCYLELIELVDDGLKIDHTLNFTTPYRYTFKGIEYEQKEASKDLTDAWSGSIYLANRAEKIFNFSKVIQNAQSNKTNFMHNQNIQSFGNNFVKNYYT
jgi:hypothetical protein